MMLAQIHFCIFEWIYVSIFIIEIVVIVLILYRSISNVIVLALSDFNLKPYDILCIYDIIE